MRVPARRTFHGVQLSDLVERDLIEVGATLVDRRLDGENATALVTSEGYIEIEGEIYESPSAAAAAVLGTSANGWEFWHTPVDDVLRPLSVLRSEYMRQSGQTQSAEA